MTKLSVILACVLVLGQVANTYPFEVLTHSALSGRAVGNSNLDGFLRFILGYPAGIDEMFAGMRVFEWIQEGSVREDDGLRSLNHFHNPLRTWDTPGFGFSSIIWGQGTTVSNEFRWQNARISYLTGLSAGT